LAIGDINIDGVAINDIYNGEGFGVIFFEIERFCPSAGFRLPLPLTPDGTVVKPGKYRNYQHAQDKYNGSSAPAHRVSGFLTLGQ
jgi:hypothetical protein